MSGPDWQKVAKELGTSDKERLAIWMIDHGFATGHGDTLDDLLHEMAWQVAELRMDVGNKNRLITELKDVIEDLCDCLDEEFGPTDSDLEKRRPWSVVKYARNKLNT